MINLLPFSLLLLPLLGQSIIRVEHLLPPLGKQREVDDLHRQQGEAQGGGARREGLPWEGAQGRGSQGWRPQEEGRGKRVGAARVWGKGLPSPPMAGHHMGFMGQSPGPSCQINAENPLEALD